MCSSLQMLNKIRNPKEKEFSLRVRNRESVLVEAVGEARLVFEHKFLLLDNVYFIPNISKNLISVYELYKQSFSICFNYNEIIILRNGVQIVVLNWRIGFIFYMFLNLKVIIHIYGILDLAK